MTRSSRRVCRTALCYCGRPKNLAEPRTFGKNFSKESSAPLCAPNGFRRRGRHSTDRALGCQGKGRKSFRAVTKGGTCEGQHAGREDAQDTEVMAVCGSSEGGMGVRECAEPSARRPRDRATRALDARCARFAARPGWFQRQEVRAAPAITACGGPPGAPSARVSARTSAETTSDAVGGRARFAVVCGDGPASARRVAR